MNLRHAVALVLLCWYLMIPPVTGPFESSFVNPEASLSQWWRSGPCRSANSCGADQEYLLKYAQRTLPELKPGSLQWETTTALELARCVAANDPLLTKPSTAEKDAPPIP